MKKNQLAALSLVFFTCLIIFSCRRSIVNLINDQVVPTSNLESAKVWYSINTKSNADAKVKLNPKWNSSWMLKTSHGDFLIVPASEKTVKNRKYRIRRVFVFSFSGTRASNGSILEFMGYNYNVSDNLEKLLKEYGNGVIPGFSGTILEYNINYKRQNSSIYEDGKRLNATSFLTHEKAGKTSTIQIAEAKKQTMSSVTIEYVDWTYNLAEDCSRDFETASYFTNDHLTRIVYTEFSYSCPSEESNSGSGSDNSNENGSSSDNNNNNSGTPNYGGPPPGSNEPPPPTFPPPPPPSAKIILNYLDRLKYPKLATIFYNFYKKVANNPKMLDALVKYSNMTKAQVLQYLNPSQGPTISITTYPQSIYAQYVSNTIYLNDLYLDAMSSSPWTPDPNLEFFISAVVLHEYVHFGNDFSMDRFPSRGTFDAGAQWENSTFGGKTEYDLSTHTLRFVKIPQP
jgi:hypothetical protein